MAKKTILSAVVMIVACFGLVASAEVTFEWATVNNPGNAADPLNSTKFPGIGSVVNVYRIAKHEVTNDQYAEFLNAVAVTDTHIVYHRYMGLDFIGGITQSGSSNIFTYKVRAKMGNKPVNYVSFFNAMRFVNWLHNGQPTGVQEASTTEDGVYTISDGLSEVRATHARFFIPTENEWYKAAYHQPSSQGGDADGYWLYPTATNDIPTVATATINGDIGNPGTNVVNYGEGANWNLVFGNVTTVGTAGCASESFYGTSDQGGSVWEWNETSLFVKTRGLRGGSFEHDEFSLRSTTWEVTPATFTDRFVGFRVASPVSISSADLDGDGDTDLFDFALFQIELSGPQ